MEIPLSVTPKPLNPTPKEEQARLLLRKLEDESTVEA